MLLLLLIYVILFTQIVVNSRTLTYTYAFNPFELLTNFTSFFIHNNTLHYLSNLCTLFMYTYFIDPLFTNFSKHFLLHITIAHTIAVYVSYFWYKLSGCGASVLVYFLFSIVTSVNTCYYIDNWSMQQFIIISFLILFFYFDMILSEYIFKNKVNKPIISHVVHFIGLIYGYCYWNYLAPLELHLKAQTILNNTSVRPLVTLYDLHLISIFLVYLYKSENDYFIQFDKILRKFSNNKLRLYTHDYICIDLN